MARHEGQTFRNQRVSIDGNTYVRCQFHNCELVYAGGDNVGLQYCDFDNVRWTFDGPAARTIVFMTGLYNGGDAGARALIDKTIENIRRGSLPMTG